MVRRPLCPKCGCANAESSVVCENCGAGLDGVPDSRRQARERGLRAARYSGIGFLVLLFSNVVESFPIFSDQAGPLASFIPVRWFPLQSAGFADGMGIASVWMIGRGAWAFGQKHVTATAAAFGLLVTRPIAMTFVRLLIADKSESNPAFDSLVPLLRTSTLVFLTLAVFHVLAMVLVSYRLQARDGKIVLVLGAVAGVVAAGYLFLRLNAHLDAPVAQPIDLDFAVYIILRIASGLFLASAAFQAWERIDRGAMSTASLAARPPKAISPTLNMRALGGMPMASSNVCPKCGFANQPGYQFCTNCGSTITASAAPTGPPAPGYAPGPVAPPAYMPPPGYGYAGMWEAERARQVDRTKTGILLLLVGTLIGWIPFASIGLIGGLLLLIGAILVILGRKAFGPKHSRNVILSLVLFLVGIVGAVVLAILVVAATLGSFVTPDPATVLGALNTLLIGTVIISAVSGLASVLFTYELQSNLGRVLLWAGYGASVGVEVAIFLILLPLLNGLFTGGTVDPRALEAFLATISSYEYLGVISAALFAAANYIAWDRLNRRLIPAPLAPPAMPGAPPMAPPPPV